MSSKINFKDATYDLQKMVGHSIYQIVVHKYCVDFIVGGGVHTILRVKKNFQFSLDGSLLEERRIVMDHVKKYGSCRFIELLGRAIESFSLDEERLIIQLIDQGVICIIFEDSDFEPIEVIGASGPHGRKLEFYHVL